MLLGPQIAAEAAGLPVAALMPNIYLLPGPRPAAVRHRLAAPRGARSGGRATPRWRGWGGACGRRGLPPVNAARARLGLGPLGAVWEQLDRADRVLVLTSPSFDFPARLPANVRYVGPRLDDPAWVEPWQAPPGDEPLVLVSLSTGHQDQLALLRRIVGGARRAARARHGDHRQRGRPGRGAGARARAGAALGAARRGPAAGRRGGHARRATAPS